MSGTSQAGAANAPVEYADASPEVRAVYDDIMATRKTDWVNNYWKVLANHPPSLRRMWAASKEIMGPGALDPADEGAHLHGGERDQRLQVLHRFARRRRPQEGHDAGTAR